MDLRKESKKQEKGNQMKHKTKRFNKVFFSGATL
jgi:hypothetical protein